ncbi:MAG TPA: hypothetical protein VFE62_21510 [Gemmataceae bacterium]|nr:hypothetical protein [Gemmataceae bacterium]
MSGPGTWSAWLHRHWLPIAMAACAVCALTPFGLGQLPIIIINAERPSLGTPIERYEGPGDAEESEPIIVQRTETPAPQIINFPIAPKSGDTPQVIDFPVVSRANEIPKTSPPAYVSKPMLPAPLDIKTTDPSRKAEPPAPQAAKSMLPPIIDRPDTPGEIKEPMPLAIESPAPKPMPLMIDRPAEAEVDPTTALPRTDVTELPRPVEKPAAPTKSPDLEFVPATTTKVGELPTELAKELTVDPPPPMFQPARFGQVVGLGPAPEPKRIEATQVGDPAPIEARERPRTSSLSYGVRPVRFQFPMAVTSPEDDGITLSVTNRARPPQLLEPINSQSYGHYDMPAWPGIDPGVPCNVIYRPVSPQSVPTVVPARVRVRELMVWPIRALTEPFRELLD